MLFFTKNKFGFVNFINNNINKSFNCIEFLMMHFIINKFIIFLMKKKLKRKIFCNFTAKELNKRGTVQERFCLEKF